MLLCTRQLRVTFTGWVAWLEAKVFTWVVKRHGAVQGHNVASSNVESVEFLLAETSYDRC